MQNLKSTPKQDQVIDTSAITAIFMGQNSARKVLTFFQKATENNHKIFLSVINWGEVLYVVQKNYGVKGRDKAELAIQKMHLTIIDADQNLTREAARLKATYKLPYADAFPAALSLIKNAPLITQDNDFRVVQDQIKILWI